MRDRELVRLYDRVSEHQDIDVDGPRTLFLNAPPAHVLFDAENRRHQLLRSPISLDRNRRIQEPRLPGELHRLGFIERRQSNNSTDRTQPNLSVPQLRLAVTDI